LPGRLITAKPAKSGSGLWKEGDGFPFAVTFLNIAMPTEIFKASRWTKGNLIFPTYIEVSDKSVSRRKRSWFRVDEMSMSITKVASVHIKTGMIWSEILIESSGGTDPIASHGHTKDDARRIKELIESAQSEFARKSPGAE
jgi:hypothetical protein